MEPILPIVAKTVSPYSGIIKNLFSGIKDEFIDWFQLGISEYIEDKNSKFSLTNTFISRNEKVNFYDVYFPLSLKSKKNKISSDNILAQIFSTSNCAAILGNAGCGKTMLMKHAFLQTYSKLYAIPIFIELRDLNTLDISLLDYIYSIILKNKIKPSTRIVERALEQGGFVFFFDGFDEINIELKEKLVIDIEQLVDHFNKNKFLLSSRPGANAETLPRFNTYNVQPLNHEQIIAFIEKQHFNTDEPELIQKLRKTVSTKHNDYIEYLTNPLLLSMYILTYRSYPELPKSKNKFYWNVFDTLCTKHDSISKKGAFLHPRKSKLQNENFETILEWFSYISILQFRFNFDEQYLSENLKYIKQTHNYESNVQDIIYDLTVSISILILEGLKYKFPHRTMQDYFMVLFIKNQSDESKSVIYQQKFKTIYSIPSNTNIFDLCIELDKEAFFRYYLLPLFDKFEATYQNANLIENAITLAKEVNAELILTIRDDKDANMFFGSRYVVPHIDIASYYKINVPEFFSIKYTGDASGCQSVSLLLKNDTPSNVRHELNAKVNSYRTANISNETLTSLLNDHFNMTLFESFLEKMKTQRVALKEEYKIDEQKRNSLIDFIPTK